MEASKDTVDDILKRAYDCCPDLSLSHKGVNDLKVIGHIVGLRPTRENGPRVQNEYFSKSFHLLFMLVNRILINNRFCFW